MQEWAQNSSLNFTCRCRGQAGKLNLMQENTYQSGISEHDVNWTKSMTGFLKSMASKAVGFEVAAKAPIYPLIVSTERISLANPHLVFRPNVPVRSSSK
jgi:hypothetical protein